MYHPPVMPYLALRVRWDVYGVGDYAIPIGYLAVKQAVISSATAGPLIQVKR